MAVEVVQGEGGGAWWSVVAVAVAVEVVARCDSISGAGAHLRFQLLHVFRIRRIAAAAAAAAAATAAAVGRLEGGARGRVAALVLVRRRPQAPLAAIGGLTGGLLARLSRGPHEAAHQVVVYKCTLSGGAPLACGSRRPGVPGRLAR